MLHRGDLAYIHCFIIVRVLCVYVCVFVCVCVCMFVCVCVCFEVFTQSFVYTIRTCVYAHLHM